MITPYAVRAIDLTFQLGKGNFGAAGVDQIKLSGLRCEVNLTKAQAPTPGGLATIRMYGLSLDHINSLTKAGLNWDGRKNLVLIEAGDTTSGVMTAIYNGNVVEAYPDFRNMPNVSFVVVANPGAIIQLKPAMPSSFTGATDVATALSSMAKQAGYTLENNGVSVQLASPYFPGTIWQQILSCVKAANIFAHLDSVTGTLAIWPKTGNRNGETIISPATGMIGYPEFQRNRIKVRTLFDPSIKAPPSVGKQIVVQSELTAANGKWVVNTIDYNLSSQTPGGPWEMTIIASSGPASQGGG
jgi:hypothetical protein